MQSRTLRRLAPCALILSFGCKSDVVVTTSGTGDGSSGDGDSAGEEAGDGDGTTSGDGDGTSATGDGDGTTATGDGDGTTATGDGDGDGTTATGDGDGDGATGDGDGDGTSATGDGDGTTATGDGDGTTGDGDGDGTSATGDGDGTSATGDGDGTSATGDGTSGDGDGTSGDGDGTSGDGDGTSGDGDGDGTTGDGDGDGGCVVVYRVDPAATGADDGTSWSDAVPDLGLAFSMTSLDASGCALEMWVRAGTYRPAGPGGDRDTSFVWTASMGVYGGFAGTETARSERDWIANPTILSGDLNDDDSSTGNAENSRTVLSIGAPIAVLDGFEIRGGNADGAEGSDAASLGGGIYLDPTVRGNPGVESQATLRDLRIVDNSAAGGGGVFGDDYQMVIEDVAFTSNTVTGSVSGGGGGLRQGSGASSLGGSSMTRCTFSGNVATDEGGGASFAGAASDSFTVTDSVFDANSGGAGGAMYSSVPLVVAGSTFRENNAVSQGGGGAISAAAGIRLSESSFVENGQVPGAGGIPTGGAVTMGPGDFNEVTGNRFIGNYSEQYGPAVYIQASSTDVLVQDNVFAGNWSFSACCRGALEIRGSSPPVSAIVNNTFFSNQQIGYYSDISDSGSVVANNLFWGNGESNYEFPTAPGATLSYNVIEGGAMGGGVVGPGNALGDCQVGPMFVDYTSSISGSTITTSGDHTYTLGDRIVLHHDGVERTVTGVSSNIITIDTVEVDADGGVNDVIENWGTRTPSATPYAPTASTACIDAGDGVRASATDVYGNPRYDDPTEANTGNGTPAYADIGAVEYQGGNCQPTDCDILGTCYADSAVNPSNECQFCDVATDAFDWTDAGGSVSCDDADDCTSNDTCDGAGACAGISYNCSGNGTCNAADDFCTCDPEFGGNFCNACSGFANGTYPSCALPPWLTNWPALPGLSGICATDLAGVDCATVGGSPPVCGAPALAYCGQDGQYAGNARVLTCKDGGGVVEPCTFPAQTDDVMEDSLTGLTWTRTRVGGGPVDWQTAFDTCESLTWGGFSDWELPAMPEWMSLATTAGPQLANGGVIAEMREPTAFVMNLWSATSQADSGTFTGLKNTFRVMNDASTGATDPTDAVTNGAYCVRGRQPLVLGRYGTGGIAGEPTITDSVSGLEWADTVTSAPSWANALGICEDLDHGGSTDWRLPSKNEFDTIADWMFQTFPPGPEAFPGFSATVERAWTSTPACADTCAMAEILDQAWFVFAGAAVPGLGESFSADFIVGPLTDGTARCVRTQ